MATEKECGVCEMKQLLIPILTLSLVACGGGGGGGSPATTPTPPTNGGGTTPPVTPPTPPVEVLPLFNDVPLTLFDVASDFTECTNPAGANIQFVLPVIINADKYSDYIVHLWCGAPGVGTGNSDVLTDATPDMLVAYLSDDSGNYYKANYEVFGETHPSLGGASRKYSQGDINGDGVPDFAFAMNWEDGRSQADATTNFAETQAVLLSNTSYSVDPQYDIVKLGKPTWAHAVSIVDNTVMFAGFMANDFQAFRYTGTEWIDVQAEYDIPRRANFANGFTTTGADVIVGNDYDVANNRSGMSLHARNDQQQWQLQDSYWFDVIDSVPFINWTGDIGYSDIVQIGDKKYFGAAIDAFCVNGDTLVAKISAAATQDGEVISGVQYSQNDLLPAGFFQVFNIANNKLELMENVLQDQVTNANFNFFSCDDVTGDSRMDIVQQSFSMQPLDTRETGGVPDIYVNNGADQLYRYDTTEFPTLSDTTAPAQGYFTDVTNNGTPDLVVYALSSGRFSNIEIYTTNDYIK